jgi:hypothetical protein
MELRTILQASTFSQLLLSQGNVQILHEDASIIPTKEIFDIAILGMETKTADATRAHLAKFSRLYKPIQILDLGNLTNADQSSSVLSFLKEIGLPVICIGISVDQIHDFVIPHTHGVNNTKYFSNTIPNLEGVDVYGFQRHLVELSDVATLERSSKTSMSLGYLAGMPDVIEPNLRGNHGVLLDPAVLKKSDAPFVSNSKTTGITLETLCLYLHHAALGINHCRLGLITPSNFEFQEDLGELYATILWYYLDSISQKNQSERVPEIDTHIVHINQLDHALIFEHHIEKGQWWVKFDQDEAILYACTEQEYRQVIEGEIPNRLFQILCT